MCRKKSAAGKKRGAGSKKPCAGKNVQQEKTGADSKKLQYNFFSYPSCRRTEGERTMEGEAVCERRQRGRRRSLTETTRRSLTETMEEEEALHGGSR
ncbi:hypothetical protein SESBI_41992 [Sesbania bispinosa]|nr:hypothetical protein SESBI_41992 [Sesbania bispinosa]